MSRARLRELGITIGHLPTGRYNAITDVPGVWVGHRTLIYDKPRVARTGVTVVVPREGNVWSDNVCAGFHVFNGSGEMTGAHWLAESGLLTSPIAITNTHQVGLVRDALIEYAIANGHCDAWLLPVVAETYDGWLNDISAFHVTKDDVYEALASAKGGPVAEGNVGGGTGTICHEFKGGIGTSSRVVEVTEEQYTVGVLVQSNYGYRHQLQLDGVPIGREIGLERVPGPGWERMRYGGSIIVIIATDAPLLPLQCKRLAQRATVGLARVGGIGANNSGDIFLAFSTANHISASAHSPPRLKMIPQYHLRLYMNALFEAVVEATEEAILNSLTAAETMTGFMGHTVHALPLNELRTLMAKYRSQRTKDLRP